MADNRLLLTPKGRAFLSEWLSESDYVEARTSGSTGTPKKIRLPKSDMRVSARATNRFFGIGPDSLLVCPLSADYIAGKMMVVRAVEAGCRLVMVEPTNHIDTILPEIIAGHGAIDLLPLVPSQCGSFMAVPVDSPVRNVIVGGAPVSDDTERCLVETGRSVWATYGMTETCSHVAVRHMGQPYFEAMPGISFSVDTDGRLMISAPDFSFRKLVTNDIVSLADNCRFRWLGRADNVVNSGGIKIFPEQLERELAPRVPFPFYFKGEPDPKWGTRLVLIARCSEEEREWLEDLCRGCLPAYSVPKAVRRVDAIPMAANGKIRRL